MNYTESKYPIAASKMQVDGPIVWRQIHLGALYHPDKLKNSLPVLQNGLCLVCNQHFTDMTLELNFNAVKSPYAFRYAFREHDPDLIESVINDNKMVFYLTFCWHNLVNERIGKPTFAYEITLDYWLSLDDHNEGPWPKVVAKQIYLSAMDPTTRRLIQNALPVLIRGLSHPQRHKILSFIVEFPISKIPNNPITQACLDEHKMKDVSRSKYTEFLWATLCDNYMSDQSLTFMSSLEDWRSYKEACKDPVCARSLV